MVSERPKVLVAGGVDDKELYLAPEDQQRLASFADWSFVPCKEGALLGTDGQSQDEEAWIERIGDAEAIAIYPGAPNLSAELIERNPTLKIVGELNGDRFAKRIDVEKAWEKGVETVDTTNGSSYPVAEWALGLILVSLRNAGYYMRRFLAGDCRKTSDNPSFLRGELTGKRVGLIGCGHAGRRLVELLRPFNVEISVYDPYLSRELAEALDLRLTSLERVLSQSDELIPSGTVLANVSRGPIIDGEALVERLKRGDIIAGLDVFDPDPIPAGHEITELENVFLSPHIAGVTAASYRRFFTLMVDELQRFFHGYETYYNLTPRSLADRRGHDFAAR